MFSQMSCYLRNIDLLEFPEGIRQVIYWWIIFLSQGKFFWYQQLNHSDTVCLSSLSHQLGNTGTGVLSHRRLRPLSSHYRLPFPSLQQLSCLLMFLVMIWEPLSSFINSPSLTLSILASDSHLVKWVIQSVPCPTFLPPSFLPISVCAVCAPYICIMLLNIIKCKVVTNDESIKGKNK